MRVLLISVGDEILRHPEGAVAERLRSYARRAGSITQVTYSPAAHRCQAMCWGDEPGGRPHPGLLPDGEGARPCSDRLWSIPTRSGTRVMYVADAIRIGHSILRRDRFDLIETQDPVMAGVAGLILGRMHRVPVVIGCHHEYTTSKAWITESLRNRVESSIARGTITRADGVRAVSRRVAEGARELGVASERVGVASVPIDARMYARGRDETPARRGWSESPARESSRRVLFAGRVERQKDVPAIIRAVAGISGARLDVVGAGSQLRACRALAESLGVSDRVAFHGAVVPADLSDFYWTCDVFTTPSLYEGYGRVFAEAAIHGAPSVGTRVGGIVDIVDDSNGVLVAPGDPDALRVSLRSFLDDPARATAVGQNAWRRGIERFNPESDVERIVTFWSHIATLGCRT